MAKNAMWLRMSRKIQDLQIKICPLKRLNEALRRKDGVIQKLKETIKELQKVDSIKKAKSQATSVEKCKKELKCAKRKLHESQNENTAAFKKSRRDLATEFKQEMEAVLAKERVENDYHLVLEKENNQFSTTMSLTLTR